jgi:phosphoribosylanthranilate isomerase
MRVRVKICGITSARDALVAATAGADAIGLVFAESPRKVSIETARRIVSSLPPFVCPVGVFVDAELDEVESTAAAVRLGAVQLHGEEAPAYVKALEAKGVRVIKAIRVGTREDASRADLYDSGIMFDARSSRAAGGTGETFPWEYAVELARRRPVILSGGLTPENVEKALKAVPAWAVDVSSGVEASKGTKDAEKIRRFIEAVGESKR